MSDDQSEPGRFNSVGTTERSGVRLSAAPAPAPAPATRPVRGGDSTAADGGSAPRRLDSLTGIRFLAAFFVFMFHMSLVVFDPFSSGPLRRVFGDTFASGGWVGVSLFFVLSGFVLTWTAKPQVPTRPFWRKRLLKIFPTHAATWVITMVAVPGTGALVAVTNLSLLHTWVPVHSFFMSVNSPSWSLCSELLFYLLFPFLLPLVRKIPRGHLVTAVLAMLAVTVAVQLLAQLLPARPLAPEGYPISVLRYWLVYYFPLSRLPEFVVGMLVCRLVRETRLLRVNVGLAALLVVGGYVLDSFVPFELSLVTVELLPIAILVGALASADTARLSRILRTRLFQWLGNVSFGFYMSQAPVIIYLRLTVMKGKLYSTPEAIGVVVMLFAVTLALGALMHHGVENPSMRRWAKSRKALPSATPASAAGGVS